MLAPFLFYFPLAVLAGGPYNPGIIVKEVR